MVKPVHLLQLGKEARLGNGIKDTSAPAQLSTPLEASPAGPTVSLVSVCWLNQAWDLGPPTGQNMAGDGQPEGVQGSLTCRIQLDHCPSGGAQVTVLRARCVAGKQDSNPLLHHIFLWLYFQVWGQEGEKSKIGMQGKYGQILS